MLGWVLVVWLLGSNVGLFLSSLIGRRFAKGTRGRYVFTSVAWACVPGAVIYYPLMVVLDGIFGGDYPVWKTMLFFGITVWCIYDLVKDDDDNYWRRKRKRLVQRICDRRRILVPTAVGATR